MENLDPNQIINIIYPSESKTKNDRDLNAGIEVKGLNHENIIAINIIPKNENFFSHLFHKLHGYTWNNIQFKKGDGEAISFVIKINSAIENLVGFGIPREKIIASLSDGTFFSLLESARENYWENNLVDLDGNEKISLIELANVLTPGEFDLLFNQLKENRDAIPDLSFFIDEAFFKELKEFHESGESAILETIKNYFDSQLKHYIAFTHLSCRDQDLFEQLKIKQQCNWEQAAHAFNQLLDLSKSVFETRKPGEIQLALKLAVKGKQPMEVFIKIIDSMNLLRNSIGVKEGLVFYLENLMGSDFETASKMIEIMLNRGIQLDEIKTTLDFIKKNGSKLFEEAKDKKGPVLLITKERSGDALKAPIRSMQFQPDGTIYFNFSKKSLKKDKLIGKGAFKIVTEYINLKTGETGATASLIIDKIKNPKGDIFGEIALNIIAGNHENVATIYPETVTQIYSKKREAEKIRYKMPFYNGGQLQNAFSKLSGDEKHLICINILKGLVHLHSKGIVHCDLKPKNIFLVRNSEGAVIRAVVGDLGLAHMVGKTPKYPKGGTKLYFPPELYFATTEEGKLEANGFARDAWAMGAILAELYLGVPRSEFLTFRKKNQEHIIAYLESKNKDDPVCPIGSPIRQVIYGLLNPNPGDRLTPARALEILGSKA